MNERDAGHISSDFKGAFDVPAYARAVLKAIEGVGFEAWLVGGFVRDRLMGRRGNDIDLATNADWRTVKSACEAASMRVHETGTAHGTVTICPFPDDPRTVEVTTFRQDGSYRDSRHPEEVEFVDSIVTDLARRDFTVNAMAFHPERGLVDPFGGIDDLRRRVLRCVGDPRRRFTEDALRILRGCRFRSQLGFEIDSDTRLAMSTHKHLLCRISAERIRSELDGFVLGEHVHDAFLDVFDVLAFILPEITAMKDCEQNTKYHIYDVLEHTAFVMQYAPADLTVRWAALCHDMGKPPASFRGEDGVSHFYEHPKLSVALARPMLERLKMSPRFVDDVALLVRYHDHVVARSRKSIHRMMAKLQDRDDLFRGLCRLKIADSMAQAPEYHQRARDAALLLEAFDELQEQGEPFSVKDLAINGHDVIERGVSAGPSVGALLNRLFSEVSEGSVKNERDDLLARLEDLTTSESQPLS